MELTVISGKGGTGKTTIAMGMIDLERKSLEVDCDVEAPNLYLYFGDGTEIKKDDFYGEKKALVDKILCTECGECQQICQFGAVVDGEINDFKCEGCGACTLVCPEKAVQLIDEKTADVYLTEVEKGVISHAIMKIGSEGSGKLVTRLRKNAEELAEGFDVTINDGSPGIGCPVIASIADSDAVLIVAEPTKSGRSDFLRIIELCKHFGLLIYVCINKADLNNDIADDIRHYCIENNLLIVGDIPYDDTVVKSINELRPITRYNDSKAGQEIKKMWKKVKSSLLEKEE